MAKAIKRKSIDFLNPINPPTDIWTTIYNWVFTVGRYVLVGIEALLLIVFFSRFILDEINSDLTEEINDKVTILSDQEFRSKEVLFRNIHTLLLDVKKVKDNQVVNSDVIAQVTSSVPATLELNSFSFNRDKVAINLKSTDIKAIKDYEFSLRQSNKIKDVTVSLQTASNSNSVINASISFTIVNEEKE